MRNQTQYKYKTFWFYQDVPLHISSVQGADAVSQRLVRVSRDLFKLVGLHLLKETGQVLLPRLQLSPLTEEGKEHVWVNKPEVARSHQYDG